VVYPEPDRGLCFSTAKDGNAATGLSHDRSIFHGIL